MEEVFSFSWDVSKAGYRWEDVRPGEQPFQEATGVGPFITDGIPWGTGEFVVKRYNPLRMDTALFRTFAETEPTQVGILQFANEYGLLGDVHEAVPLSVDDSDAKTVGNGEPFGLWEKEIRVMREGVALMDAVTDKDVRTLSAHVRWSGNAVMYATKWKDDGPDVSLKSGGSWSLIASEDHKPHLLEGIRVGDVIRPAELHVQKLVNDHLKGRASPRLLWDPDYVDLGLFFVPESLIGALWLQMAWAVDGNKDYRRCEECRRWIEIAPDSARTNKRYCSNACRTRAYRRRKSGERTGAGG